MIKQFLKAATGLCLLAPIVMAVSCTNNSQIQNTALSLTPHEVVKKYNIAPIHLDHNNDKIENIAFKGTVNTYDDFRNGDSNTSWASNDKMKLLPSCVYNAIVDVFNNLKNKRYDADTIMQDIGFKLNDNRFSDNEIADVIIADKQFYVEILPLENPAGKIIDYMRDSDIFRVEEINTSIGTWMGRVKFYDKGENTVWEHGTSHMSNYGITGYPLYAINNHFANLGVSNQNASAQEIYEITYNHNA